MKTITAYNFKGHPTATNEQLLTDHTIADVDWAASPALNAEMFTTLITYDALDRPVTTTDPGNNITRHEYDKSGALYAVYLTPDGGSETAYVTATYHNAKGQREKIYYGNGTNTAYTYDDLSLRLTRLLTRKATDVFQDLNYWYDPVGNITTMADNAQRALYFNNSVTLPEADYTYDPLYRLIRATGREQIGIATFGSSDNYNDSAWMGISHKGDDNNTQNYTQIYTYDAVGNIKKLRHIATAGSYTRNYTYDTASNKLLSTTVGSDTYSYQYDLYGNMTDMPHLAAMDWNTQRQLSHADLGGGGDAYYQYSAGERSRKVIANGIIKEERIYLGSYELYRKYTSGVLDIERTTVHINDNAGRIAMLEVRTAGSDASAASLVRYVYSNHLSTASLELDNNAAIISYEEYHPYGTTSYQAMNATINAVAKRYRYTGKERDEETGLNYHGARYYVIWLCRWVAVDPLEKKFSPASPYNYANNNPIISNDPSGMAPPPTGRDPLTANEFKPSGSENHQNRLNLNDHHIGDAGNGSGGSGGAGDGDGDKGKTGTGGVKYDNSPAVDNTGTPFATQQATLKQALDHTLPEQNVIASDYYGKVHNGTESEVKSEIRLVLVLHTVEVGKDVASGPAAAAGFLIADEKGAKVGASVDAMMMARAVEPISQPKAVELIELSSKEMERPTESFQIKSIEDIAKDLTKQLPGNKLRVTIPSIDGEMHYDLASKLPGGGVHRKVSVPHIQRSRFNYHNGVKDLNKDRRWVEPMTRQDLSAVARFLKSLKK